MNILPESDVLIVKEIKPDEKIGSLIVPNQVLERDSLVKAEVLRCGPGQMNRAGQVISHGFKAGDVIVFDKMRGYPVTYGGQYYLFVNAHQVFGKVDEVSN